MKTVANTIAVSLSNLKERLKTGSREPRVRYSKMDDENLLPILRRVTDQRASYGYRRVTEMVNRELFVGGCPNVNHKRIYRIMKQNSLLLQRFGKKATRTHDGKIETSASNVRWCSDGFTIQCWNGDQVAVAFSLDCHDREVMAWIAGSRGIDHMMICDLMTETIEHRFGNAEQVPERLQWLSDNGPAYTCHETVRYGRSRGFDVRTTPSYSPESNGMAEAFVKTFKRDYVWLADLSSGDRVREQLKNWFEDYNEHAPHKALLRARF